MEILRVADGRCLQKRSNIEMTFLIPKKCSFGGKGVFVPITGQYIKNTLKNKEIPLFH